MATLRLPVASKKRWTPGARRVTRTTRPLSPAARMSRATRFSLAAMPCLCRAWTTRGLPYVPWERRWMHSMRCKSTWLASARALGARCRQA